MAIVKMKRLQILALERDHDAMLRRLQHMGCVEISEPDTAALPDSLRRCDTAAADCLARQRQLQTAMDTLRRIAPPKKAGLLAPRPRITEMAYLDEAALARELETAQRMMELVGIAPLADRGIRRISGGERQLTLIARALAQQARILLMDEPAANLDYGNQFRLLQQVRRLTEQGYTVLLSTHDPEHALRFATHVLALHGGTVAACGPVEEMLTEELLHTLYRIPLTVAQVPVTGGTVRSCVYDPAKP